MTEDAQGSLAAVRDPQATGPSPDPEHLRRAYLELLKLALCDLVGTQTTSVGAMGPRQVMARELRDDGRRLRAAGMDWPLHGLTMVGLRRLDDLQACVEQVVGDGVAGDVVEAGSWRGGASMLIRATLDSLGDSRRLVVADSFQGFPSDEGDEDMEFEIMTAPLQDVRASFARLGLMDGVELLPGFFDRTLAGLADRHWALVRLDADTYEATDLALRILYPGLAVGGVIVIDDYGSWEGCRRAVDDFRARHEITEPLEQIDFTAYRWRRASDAPLAPEPPPPPPAGEPPASSDGVAPTLTVPSADELTLREQLAATTAHAAAAEAELARLRARPWRGARAWWHQRGAS